MEILREEKKMLVKRLLFKLIAEKIRKKMINL
jgi:hypothetical protein